MVQQLDMLTDKDNGWMNW